MIVPNPPVGEGSMRTPATQLKVEEHNRNRKKTKDCTICKEEPIKKFVHWQIHENAFPYDAIFSVSHMLFTVRHVTSIGELSIEELTELKQLRETYLEENYHLMLENFNSRRSICHFHFHLLVYK